MSILAKLHFCSEERDLLHTNLDYHRLTRWNGKLSTWVKGGYLTVTFQSEMYDDSFLEAMIADRYDNKRIEYPYNLYALRDGKIVFYKDEMIEGQEFFVYSFKDAVIISYHETFDNQTGMYVTLTISPAIQDYRFFSNMKWDEKSPTRFVKTWQENYIPPVKEKLYVTKRNIEPRLKSYHFEDENEKRISKEKLKHNQKFYLVVLSENSDGKKISINLNDERLDYKYNEKTAKGDVIKGITITGDKTKISLTAVRQKKK